MHAALRALTSAVTLAEVAHRSTSARAQDKAVITVLIHVDHEDAGIRRLLQEGNGLRAAYRFV